MKTQSLKFLARKPVGVAVMFALTSAHAVFSQELVLSRATLQATLEKAVLCNTDGIDLFNKSLFFGGPGDPKAQLEGLGVRIIDESTQSGPISVTYRFPSGIKVFGYDASEAKYFDGSTMIFFISLRSGSDRLPAINKTLKLKPVPKGNPEGYGLFKEIDVRYIRKLGDEKDSPPDTIFSGTGGRQNYIVIGCQNLAW